ncbi:hypothetical protein AVEN_97894-1 [Araneus ventricosus]|uniref:Integrase catalytic domain-containing protein n=1 Tax=Araneus ventricosus TaxID=182803 RepID=A0A4Y2NK26_ARAVE|nr:hypothetical protein AVEN_97894-1 [Araneus ventricosus]
MNGTIERYNTAIIEGVRALLHESKLPTNLWAEYVNTQTYLRNRFPHKALKGKAPLNVWSVKKFSKRHFKRIAYVFIQKRYRNKLEPNAQKGIMIGYALGYRIFFPQSRKVTDTKQIEFSSNETPIPKLSDKTECDGKRVCVTRQKGKTKGRIDVYYYPAANVRLRIGTQADDFSTHNEDISDREAHSVEIKIPNNFEESQNVLKRENWCSAMKEELEVF